MKIPNQKRKTNKQTKTNPKIPGEKKPTTRNPSKPLHCFPDLTRLNCFHDYSKHKDPKPGKNIKSQLIV